MSIIKLVGHKAPIPVIQILYVLGDGNYSNVYLTGGKRVLATMTLKDVEVQSTTLLRINKGTLVNQHFIAALGPTRSARHRISLVCMTDGTELSVSRRRWKVLLETKSDDQVILKTARPQ
ncbi:LytTR family DNA-binding domain-containing protein [Spirosoma radiotolerans]|uniref:HTH LytTR-type domain-containing protein n=1 Tax=Spirosoma radiotolerans TaxID=1379870 RepID=A0A0E3ZTH2_9BACT|nr:LytTR family DNA-binding domain-containing protein [Spirosoma radiotolerans]AKD54034.1 hypothetical protein SD10_03060 [Spirosoma radiotolerans]